MTWSGRVLKNVLYVVRLKEEQSACWRGKLSFLNLGYVIHWNRRSWRERSCLCVYHVVCLILSSELKYFFTLKIVFYLHFKRKEDWTLLLESSFSKRLEPVQVTLVSTKSKIVVMSKNHRTHTFLPYLCPPPFPFFLLSLDLFCLPEINNYFICIFISLIFFEPLILHYPLQKV